MKKTFYILCCLTLLTACERYERPDLTSRGNDIYRTWYHTANNLHDILWQVKHAAQLMQESDTVQAQQWLVRHRIWLDTGNTDITRQGGIWQIGAYTYDWYNYTLACTGPQTWELARVDTASADGYPEKELRLTIEKHTGTERSCYIVNGTGTDAFLYGYINYTLQDLQVGNLCFLQCTAGIVRLKAFSSDGDTVPVTVEHTPQGYIVEFCGIREQYKHR